MSVVGAHRAARHNEAVVAEGLRVAADPVVVTVRAVGSMVVDFGQHDPQRSDACGARRVIGGAIWPSDRIPVATWYSRGWKRW